MISENRKYSSQNPTPSACCNESSLKNDSVKSEMIADHFPCNRQATFIISGMTCNGCAERIKNALTKLPGVMVASVNFDTQQATIDFDPERINSQSIRALVSKTGYAIEEGGIASASVNNAVVPAKRFHLKPYIYGLLTGTAVIAFYLSLITLTSDWINARFQFADYRWWIIGLAAGLGIQITLYVTMRRRLSSQALRGAGAGVAASGSMSATAMALCCSHYLVTLLPIIGLPFLSVVAASLEQYQVQFFAAGVIFNLIGIAIMLRKYRQNNIPAVAVSS